MHLESHQKLKLHTKSVVALNYSEDGKYLASAGADKKAIITNSSTGETIKTLEGKHTHGLNDCKWMDNANEQERMLVTCSDDETIKLWDIEMGTVVSSWKGYHGCVYSISIMKQSKVIISGGYDGSIVMFHVSCREAICSFRGHANPIVSVDVNNNSTREFLTGSHDGYVRLWDTVQPSTCLMTLSTSKTAPSPISSVSYSPNYRFWLISSMDSTHRLLDSLNPFNSPYCNPSAPYPSQPSLPSPFIRQYQGHRNESSTIKSLFFSRNAKESFIMSGSEDGKIHSWDLSTADAVMELEDCHKGEIYAMAQTNNAPTISTDGQTGDKEGVNQSISQIATGGRDGFVRIWNVVDS